MWKTRHITYYICLCNILQYLHISICKMLIDYNIQIFEKIVLEIYFVNINMVSWILVAYRISNSLKLKVKWNEILMWRRDIFGWSQELTMDKLRMFGLGWGWFVLFRLPKFSISFSGGLVWFTLSLSVWDNHSKAGLTDDYLPVEGVFRSQSEKSRHLVFLVNSTF